MTCDCHDSPYIPGLHSTVCDEEITAGLIGSVQRHDDCQLYEGDLEAAYALAQHLASITGDRWMVRYYPDGQDEEDEGLSGWIAVEFTGTPDDGICIASETNPWVERQETA